MGRRGFTLLEVVLALALVALAVTTILPNVATAAKMTGKARKMVTAAQLARNLIHTIELEKKVETTKEDGKFEDHPEFSWKYEIEQVKMAEVFSEAFFKEKNTGAKDLYLDRLFRVKVKILWEREGEEQVYETYSLLFAQA